MQAPLISRLTTVFHPGQDRIRISGLVKSGQVEVIWITQRLANRLIPVIAKWLEGREQDTLRADLLQSVHQERASQQQAENAKERAVPAENPSEEWLALSLDIQQLQECFRIIFKNKEKNPDRTAVLELQPLLLRQWLNVLMLAYRQAQWPLSAWPEWMLEQVEPETHAKNQRALH